MSDRVDDFIAAQLQVIRDGNFSEYLPTLWVETPSQVNVSILMDELEGREIDTAAGEWARHIARKNDYFLAFRADNSHLRIVARVAGMASVRLVAIN